MLHSARVVIECGGMRFRLAIQRRQVLSIDQRRHYHHPHSLSLVLAPHVRAPLHALVIGIVPVLVLVLVRLMSPAVAVCVPIPVIALQAC